MSDGKQAYIVRSWHPDLNTLPSSSAVYVEKVEVCKTCGCVFVHIDHRLGQCPLGHDQ